MRNIEIKAKIQDVDHVILKAQELSNTKETIIKQHDTFFKVQEGRLKLRKFEVSLIINALLNTFVLF